MLPECFERPTEHAIQKSTGVMTIHVLLLSVIEHVRSAGDSVLESSSYERVLETPLTELQGENPRVMSLVALSSGVSVLQARPAHLVAMRGDVLLAKIRSRLPKIEIE